MIRGARHGVILMSVTDRRNDREPRRASPFNVTAISNFLREVQLGDGRILHIPQTRAEMRAAEHVSAQAAQKSKVMSPRV